MDYRTYGTGALSDLFSLSARQLQWWDEMGVIKPAMVGHRREYSYKQAILVGIAAELRRKGMSLQAARGVLKRARHMKVDQDVCFIAAATMVSRCSPRGTLAVINDAAALVKWISEGTGFYCVVNVWRLRVMVDSAMLRPGVEAPVDGVRGGRRMAGALLAARRIMDQAIARGI